MATSDELIQQLGEPYPSGLIWMFACTADRAEAASHFASHLPSGFETQVHDKAAVQQGSYLVVAKHADLATPQDVRVADAAFKQLALQSGLSYLGVDVVEAIDLQDLDEVMGWIEFESAPDRLTEFAALEFEPGEAVPWAFLIGAETIHDLHATAKRLQSVGYSDLELFEDVDEDGQVGLCIYVQGNGNAGDLRAECQKIERVVTATDAFPVGVQFYDRDDVGDVFGDDPDEGDERS